MNTQQNQLLKTHAAQIYLAMDTNERAIIKFGMTPLEKVSELESVFPEATGREIALAFMEATKIDGGMVA